MGKLPGTGELRLVYNLWLFLTSRCPLIFNPFILCMSSFHISLCINTIALSVPALLYSSALLPSLIARAVLLNTVQYSHRQLLSLTFITFKSPLYRPTFSCASQLN